MPILSEIITGIPEIRSITDDMQGGIHAIVGLCASAKAHVVSAISNILNQTALVIVPDEATAAAMTEDLNLFFGGGCEVFPYRDVNLFEARAASRETESQRLRVMGLLRRNCLHAVVMTPDAAMSFIIPSDEYDKGTFCVYEGESYNISELCGRLSGAGYVRTELVDAPGQFSHRGDLLDVFAPGSENPVRIEFWGDECDSISFFDKDTQRRGERAHSIVCTPAREMPSDMTLASILRDEASKLSADSEEKSKLIADASQIESGLSLPWADKYLPLRYGRHTILTYGNFSVFICEYNRCWERAQAFYSRSNEDLLLLVEKHSMPPMAEFCFSADEFLASLCDAFVLDEFTRTSYPMPLSSLTNVSVLPVSPFRGTLKELAEKLAPVREGGNAVIFAGTEKAAKNLANDLASASFTAESGELPGVLKPRIVYVCRGSLSTGADYVLQKTQIISLGRQDESVRRKGRPAGERIGTLNEITAGDAVVHTIHGVGIYEGIKKVETQGITRDYLTIRYQGGDRLYVPVTQLDSVGRYIGNENTVKLSKMGGTDWSKTKQRVRTAVKDMAKELISLYSRRMNKKGYAFSPDNEWQRDFEARFAYTETDDQLACTREIKGDMEKNVPMERLLCGDVGFGKTEVALRAAFKCVTEGKQCAVLVPTTLLAWQHYQTILQRMEGFPVRVGLLCRFRSKKQQEETLKELAAGKIDIAVGTHRLVQKDVRFKNLGLMIIDEEQRFGVAQKEFLKQKYDTVDCLSLSATPIPRTLNMALSGIRDMSCIEEAPGGRQPIQTYVLEYDEGIITEAILRELRRGGQVYYMHNNTESIDSTAAKLSRLLPDARIGVGHGKLSEAALNRVWEDLVDRRIDILVCTTIIETGVDVPNANTLIIEDADRMGLSQLHQLRGRIGRSYRAAYAYFTFKQGKAVSEIATKRLDAIREFTEFGSGFRIALRDLEIRGAGNVLGGEQHGHMDSVGYDMYIKLLSEAVSAEMGKPVKEERDCSVDLPVTAHIPEKYISDANRIDAYRRIAGIATQEDADDVLDELIDRYGEPPREVQALIKVALYRQRAKALDITDISERSGTLMFSVVAISQKISSAAVAHYMGRIRVNPGAKPYYGIRNPGSNLLAAVDEFLSVAEEAVKVDNE